MNVDEFEQDQDRMPLPEDDIEGEDDEADEDDEGEDRIDENDGLYDGGIAEPVAKPSERRSASEADIVLFFSCTEPLNKFPDHPILKPAIIVQIGLDKNTKLGMVFERFVELCNEKGGPSELVMVKDLEFLHNDLLSPQDKAEDAALMKNDRILVRAESSKQRQSDIIMNRLQHEMDRNFLTHLRSLLPMGQIGARYGDVELDCQGIVTDESGTVQRVFATGLECHACIVSSRCPWLGTKIAHARHEQDRRSVVTVDATSSGLDNSHDAKSPHAVCKESDDDDEIELMNAQNMMMKPRRTGAAEIENDDDDLVSFGEDNQQLMGSEIDDSSIASDLEENRPPLLSVPVENYGPEAVRILLEYLYTNRVESLGFEAFKRASTKSLPDKVKTEAREPKVTFQTALSALALAEEASLHRLALMCEVAASQLVGINTIVDALGACESQKQATGNELPVLRNAAMEIVLRTTRRGVFELPTFRQALEERSTTLVPTLLTGTADIIQKLHGDSRSKRDWRVISRVQSGEMDYLDAVARERERFKRRVERRKNDLTLGPLSAEDERNLFEEPKRKEDSRRRSIKRMLHHVLGGARGVTVGARRIPSSQRHGPP